MKLGRLIVVAALAVMTMAAAPVRGPHWDRVIAATPEGGYRVGNPKAPTQLVEFVSYTCPHCAHFESEAGPPLLRTYVASGQVSVEYRPFLRNRIDVAASLLATCGPVAKFRGNHAAILGGQEQWMQGSTQGDQIADFGTAMRTIARDYKLYDLMTPRGYTRTQLDACLQDRAAADKLAAQTEHAVEALKVNATPSFLINGQLQDVHDWNGLRARLPTR
ncbi:MAG: thioredoxin domain-containing protein [Novosphingobium sp.]